MHVSRSYLGRYMSTDYGRSTVLERVAPLNIASHVDHLMFLPRRHRVPKLYCLVTSMKDISEIHREPCFSLTISPMEAGEQHLPNREQNEGLSARLGARDVATMCGAQRQS